MRSSCLLLVLFRTVAGSSEEADAVCIAEARCSTQGLELGGAGRREYYWPQGRGPPRHFGQSPYAFGGRSCNLSAALRWSWHHPDGRYGTTIVGKPIIDHELNIYLASVDGLRKFTSGGELVWSWQVQALSERRFVPNNPAIMDGLVYDCLTSGEVFALSMETGQLIWEVMVSASGIGGDTAFMAAHEGMVILDVDPQNPQAVPQVAQRVVALNGSDGSLLWEFSPDVGVWNFLPLFPGDGTAVFQTWNAGAYRLNLSSGAPLWRAGPPASAEDRSWTDGGPALGPNGVFYTVSSTGGQDYAFRSSGGGLHAFRVDDGSLLWERKDFDQGIYTYPVVGALAEGAALSVVTGVGSLAIFPLKIQGLLGFVPGAALGLLLSACLCCCRQAAGLRRPCACLGRTVLCMAVWAALGVLVVVTLVLKREYTHSIQAFDAESGKLQWRVDLPAWRWFSPAGDEEGLVPRWRRGVRILCLPCATSYLTLDAQGAVYFGHLDGRLYRIKDWNGDGRLDGEEEVCSFEAGSAFFTGGPSIAPGLLAAASCDTLYVFGTETPPA